MTEPTLFDDSFSISQLVMRSKNALAREFRGPVWVRGEIKSMREMRGSLYLALVDPGSFTDGTDISVDVACWPRRRALVQSQLRDAGITLAAGMEVRVQGNVTLSKLGKLQVELLALDTEALLGRQAAEKKRLLATLVAEGLFDANRSLAVPLVPLRVGLVSSEGSEGYNDFLGQLSRSPYAFDVTFAHSPVQGPTAPNLLARAIASIADVDVIAVVRGGGGELDAFDKEAVARAIAGARAPVFTGIGHTGDRSVADDVAARAHITPTECGQALVRAVGEFVAGVDRRVAQLHALTSQLVTNETARHQHLRARLASAGTTSLDRCQHELHRQGERAMRSTDRDLSLATATLNRTRDEITRTASTALTSAQARVLQLAKAASGGAARRQQSLEQVSRLWHQQLSVFDPQRQLQRGYSIARSSSGDLLQSVEQVSAGDTIVTTLADGETHSTVSETRSARSSTHPQESS